MRSVSMRDQRRITAEIAAMPDDEVAKISSGTRSVYGKARLQIAFDELLRRGWSVGEALAGKRDAE